ncbi:MAG TPA: alpha/beta hydrolase [Candidatus Nanoarchaeia archaeon]|nr:alpha/beta hydrolase [Candidatus Nanoarchaeia archaeon]
MEKTVIKNRTDSKIVVVVERAIDQNGLAFVMHGLGGFKEQSHIRTFIKAFKEKEFTVISFDTTNTFGESDGNYENATTTNYYEDLEDVIKWASGQKWYKEPFWLCGHSLGGISTALYAKKYPEKVKALAPISTVVSGQLSLETPKTKKHLENWNKSGWRISKSQSKPGLIKKLNWHNFKKDLLMYDLLNEADKLSMPVLLIVGENDDSTPLEHQQLLYDRIPGPKELHLINGAPHTFRDKGHLDQIFFLILKWIESVK